LSNSGEEVRLLQPDHPEGPGNPNAGLVPYELVEGINYGVAAPWPAQAGFSLQRVAPSAHGNEPTNWFVGSPSPGRAAEADNDLDGMPNDWETAHGLDPNSATDADGDPDEDGANNLAEYRAGTNPQSPASALRFTSVQDSSAQLVLKFHAVAGKSYELQARPQLVAGTWTTVSNIPPPAVTGELSLGISKSGAIQFYRIVLSGSQ
jgi:hypothetical protein